MSAREAVERNAEAVMSGNLAQVMADITPEALTQMLQLGAQAGGMSPAQMPNIEGYEIADLGETDGLQVFHVTFRSSIGKATLGTNWKRVMGQWKIAAVSLVSVEPAGSGG